MNCIFSNFMVDTVGVCEVTQVSLFALHIHDWSAHFALGIGFLYRLHMYNCILKGG